MIEVYQASHGGVLTLDKSLGEYHDLGELHSEISGATGISLENILLFLQDGREVKPEVLESLWRRGGFGAGSSDAAPEVLYLFNRETFWSDAEEWAAQFMEEVSLPPPLNLSAISDLSQAQAPFVIAYDHLSHLYSLFLAQAQALQIAYANLSHHLSPLIREFKTFSTKAEAELDEEESLLRSAPADLAILPKIGVHDSLVKKGEGRERERSVDSESGTTGGGGMGKTLASYVHSKKMEQVLDSCRGTHEDHVNRYNALAQSMDELALQSDAERRGSEERSALVRAEFEAGLQRIDVANNQLEVLFNSGTSGFSQDLMELDQAMRDDLIALTEIKNEYTLDIHLHLRRVAHFQVQITQLVEPLTKLDGDLRSKGAFPHLSRLHSLPFAYATAVVEVVRRKEYAEYLLDVTTKLAEVFSKFTGAERERRQRMRADTLNQIPFNIPALDNTLRVQVDLTVTTGKEALSVLNVTRRDLDDLQAWIEEMKVFKPLQDAIDQGADDPIPALQQNLDDVIRRMDVPSDDFDRMMEEAVLHSSKENGDSAHAFNQAAALEAAQEERDNLHRQLAELDLAHRQDLDLLSDEHGQRATALQTRQAELQNELMRLRNDLSDEMMARQALSTELGERNREAEDRVREQEDQNDIIVAMQAEMAQEKDRATDLGVRLQEALLDVDGLRNAEQAVIAQLQAAQDERSKHLQSLSEAQISARALEAEVARLRAELEESTRQLEKAQSDRDNALKNQSAEAERLMRDHLAEADGDRAVLEELNVKAKKEVEEVRREMEEKISAVRNAAIRESNGLKAELQMTKAQFRDAQRRESVLADELAMARDTAASTMQKEAHQSDVARDAVVLAAKYHEVCSRLMTAIVTSSTISGSTSALVARPNSPPIPGMTTMDVRDDMRESVMVKSLAHATSFDLVAFGDAVQRTIALVKKWSKSCRHYRELARNKISFRDFSKGDLALFLPTRNATTRPWMAFNISTPHHFVKVPAESQEAWKNRDSIVARIVSTEEAVAGDQPATNPFGLAEGLRFYIHQIEEYSPGSSSFKSPRRSVSSEVKTSSLLASTPIRPPLSEPGPSLLTQTSPTGKEYFPVMSPARETSPHDHDHSESDPAPPAEGSSGDKSGSPSPPSPDTHPNRLSPVIESMHMPPNPPPTASTSPVATIGRTSAPPAPTSRIPSRASATSPTMRDHATPLFTPSGLGRPASVASSAGGSHKAFGLTAALSSSPAPAMTVTTSQDGMDPTSPFADFQRKVIRKPSGSSLRTGPVPLENLHRASLEDTRRTSIGSSPLATSPPFGRPRTPQTQDLGGGDGGFAALGTGPGRPRTGSSGNTGAVTRGFSISGFGKGVAKALGSSPAKSTGSDEATGEGREGRTAKYMLQKIQGGG